MTEKKVCVLKGTIIYSDGKTFEFETPPSFYEPLKEFADEVRNFLTNLSWWQLFWKPISSLTYVENPGEKLGTLVIDTRKMSGFNIEIFSVEQ